MPELLPAPRPSARAIELIVSGEARGKQRPRFNGKTGKAFTPADTVRAENAVILEWMGQGRPMLGDGPICAKIEICMARPKAHWRKDGTLSPEGQRTPWPQRKPDLDNVAKLIFDALNGKAYRDDVAIVSMAVWKRWQYRPDEAPHTRIAVWLFG